MTSNATAATVSTLRVPGACLHYEQRGAGPILLLLPGGAGDADGLKAVADQLTDHYTVVTYDRRGLSRSTLEDAADADEGVISIHTHGDDAHRLLAEITAEPALVAGTSFGAVIGLDLIARHPEQVRTLVAHEAAIADLLPEPERTRLRQLQHEVDEAFRQEGARAAMMKLLALAGGSSGGSGGSGIGDDAEPGAAQPTPADLQRHGTNMQFFLSHDAPAAHAYQPDIPALQAARTRIVPAAGQASMGALPHRCADALAELLGIPLVSFPGSHAGHSTHPEAFAAALHDTLKEALNLGFDLNARRSTVSFRAAESSDAVSVAALHADSWRRHYRGAYSDAFLDGDIAADRLALWTRRLATPDPGSATILAEAEGRLAGFVHLVLDDDDQWGSLVDNLHVAGDRQRHGIGAALILRAARAVAERAATRSMYLWVLEQNTSAQGFYAAQGGKSVERELVEPPGGDPGRLAGNPAKFRYAWVDVHGIPGVTEA